MTLKILIIATEHSGDKLGANLIDGLNSEYSGDGKLVFQGIGGPLMKIRGMVSFYDFDEFSLMGFVELLPKITKVLRVIKDLSNYAAAWKPDLIVTIDSPDFSLKVSKRIKKVWPSAITIHYVAPSVWAWRSYRAKQMAKFVDHVLALLPFEPPLMHKVGMSCDFVGHPIVYEELPSNQDIRLFRGSLGIDRDTPILSVLPGSRKTEVHRMLPIFINAMELILEKFPNLVLIIASPPNVAELVSEYLDKTDLPIIQIHEIDNPLEFEERKRILFTTSLAAVATSGSVTLELARMGAPFVVAYRSSFITETLLKTFVKLKSATLINILTNKKDVPELLFSECTPKNIFAVISSLLTDVNLVKEQRRSVECAMAHLGVMDIDPKIRAARSTLNFLSDIRST